MLNWPLLIMMLAPVIGEVPAETPTHATVLIVVGAEGAEEYGKQFRNWAERWEVAAKQGGANTMTIGLDAPAAESDLTQLQKRLTTVAGSQDQPLWLVLIGHGTFDGKLARFNLRGPDLTLSELSEWLKPIQRPLVVINCSSSSGPFLNELSGSNRVIITATKSGHEYNFARFGDYLSSAIVDPQGDLDKDEQTSLLEAFLLASARVKEFYESEGRLMTEHALLDDNEDRLGTPPDWFQGVRAVKSAKNGASVDGLRANQWHLVRSASERQFPANLRDRRDALERQLEGLRQQKSKLTETDYLMQLEPIMLELATLYQSETRPAETSK